MELCRLEQVLTLLKTRYAYEKVNRKNHDTQSNMCRVFFIGNGLRGFACLNQTNADQTYSPP